MVRVVVARLPAARRAIGVWQMPRLRSRTLRPSIALALALSGLACSRTPEELPEWTPADHDNQGTPSPGQVDTAAPRPPGMPSLAAHGVDDVVMATWRQRCVTCHGRIGRGDGPSGPQVGAPDLTRADWQAATSDEALAKVIREGRGKMPAHAELPESTVAGLVRLIRLLGPGPGPSSPPEPSGPAAPSAAPTSSATSSPHTAPATPAASP